MSRRSEWALRRFMPHVHRAAMRIGNSIAPDVSQQSLIAAGIIGVELALKSTPEPFADDIDTAMELRAELVMLDYLRLLAEGCREAEDGAALQNDPGQDDCKGSD